MKFFTKQMLGFTVVLVALTATLGIFFVHSNTASSLDAANHQLQANADSLVQDNLTYNPITKTFTGYDSAEMKANSSLLAKQGNHFTIYDAARHKRFASNGYTPQPTTADWQRLKKGQTITKKVKHPVMPPRPRHGRPRPNNNADVSDPAMTVIEKPYFYHSKLVAVISIGSYMFQVNRQINITERNLAVGLLVGFIFALIVATIFAAQTNSRVADMQSVTQHVAEGNYDVRVKVPQSGGDEIDQLGRSLNDMTEALQAAQTEIHQQSEQRQAFLANAAHEMRTPLTTINGLLEGLEYDAIPKEDRQHSIHLMRQEAGRLIRMVNQTIDYEKLRTNKIVLQKKNFDATAVLNNLAEQLNKKASAKKDQIQVTAPDHLPVYADHDRFVQIMFNIIQNAVQFTENGTITIGGRLVDGGTELTVADTGIGMTKEQQQQMWDRFYKADQSRSNKYAESGLGMSIVAQLMHLHGGQISVDSHPGKGTTFTLKFLNQQHANN